jgi:hypothetical protein
MRRICSTLMMITAIGCAIPEDEELSTSSQELATFSNVVNSFSPAGYWKFGESTGLTAADSSGGGINGTYHSGVTKGVTGGIGGDTNAAVTTDGVAGYIEIPDRKAYSLTRAWDNFNRNPPSYTHNWASASGGESWSEQVSNGNYYSTDGQAIINPNGNSGTFQQGLPTHLLHGEMQVRATWSAHAAGGALQPVALVAQRVDNNNFVRAELRENPDTSLSLHLIKTVNGVNTYLDSQTLQGYVLGDWYYVRFRFDGVNLKAKAWRMGTPQPNNWHVEATTASADTGSIAIRSANSVSTTSEASPQTHES